MGPPAAGASGCGDRRDHAGKVIVPKRSSEQRVATQGINANTLQHLLHSCPVAKHRVQWQSPGRGCTWGEGGATAVWFWGPFAGVWCPLPFQLPPRPDLASPVQAPCPVLPGEAWGSSRLGQKLIRSSLPHSPCAFPSLPSDVARAGSTAQQRQGSLGASAAGPKATGSGAARSPISACTSPPHPTASASQPPAEHFRASSSPPGFYPCTPCQNPCSHGISTLLSPEPQTRAQGVGGDSPWAQDFSSAGPAVPTCILLQWLPLMGEKW